MEIVQYVIMVVLPLIVAGLVWYVTTLRYPPVMQRTEQGITVSVMSVLHGGSRHFREHLFTKRRSGRYRLKHSLFDWFTLLITVVPVVGFYGWLLWDMWEFILEYPGTMVPLMAVLAFDFLALLYIFNHSFITARGCVRRFEAVK
ncbi:MAG: hypothetical protein IKX54_01685 [Lachnospiraceae bacterium]|nr:hypothetical protein [Lachnospiraceae bacterium]